MIHVERQDYDVIVLGAGPVGQNAAERARASGLSVAVVERELVGGECSYWACVPSKALLRPVIALSEVRHIDASTAEENGLGRVEGLVIMGLYRNSSAVAAGLRRFDIITKVNGQPITDANQFARLVYDAKVGSTLKLEVARQGRKATVDVTVQKATSTR